MKIIQGLCATLLLIALSSCDAHREFRYSHEVCDILCTDGKVVRYEDMVSQERSRLQLSSMSIRAKTGQAQAMPSISGIYSRRLIVTASA
jgi:hypothetical protein